MKANIVSNFSSAVLGAGIAWTLLVLLAPTSDPAPAPTPVAEVIAPTAVSGTGRVEFVPGCEDVRAIKVLDKNNQVVGIARVVVQPPYTCVFNFQMGSGK